MTLIVSAVLVAMILGLYDDLYAALKLTDKGSILYLIIAKWGLLFAIACVNILLFRRFSKSAYKEYESLGFAREESDDGRIVSGVEKSIREQKSLRSKTDIILEKYDR